MRLHNLKHDWFLWALAALAILIVIGATQGFSAPNQIVQDRVCQQRVGTMFVTFWCEGTRVGDLSQTSCIPRVGDEVTLDDKKTYRVLKVVWHFHALTASTSVILDRGGLIE